MFLLFVQVIPNLKAPMSVRELANGRLNPEHACTDGKWNGTLHRERFVPLAVIIQL